MNWFWIMVANKCHKIKRLVTTIELDSRVIQNLALLLCLDADFQNPNRLVLLKK
jgi:hypothetical protein